MLNLVLTNVSHCWISVLVSYNVKAQSGDSITLLCPKTSETVTTWFRLVNRTKASCIALMIKSDKDPEYCDGFQNGHFKMETNISTVFLKIKHVDLSDSGLYFCHFFFGGRGVYYVIYLSVEGKIIKNPALSSLLSTVQTKTAAGLNLYSTTRRKQVETHVIYAASRWN
uniref:Immunoglobulin domain-containing protein n=1 Tax=Anabas testudineus TaxID=64144 RepID=A0A7N6AX09_ANATE